MRHLRPYTLVRINDGSTSWNGLVVFYDHVSHDPYWPVVCVIGPNHAAFAWDEIEVIPNGDNSLLKAQHLRKHATWDGWEYNRALQDSKDHGSVES